jgi:hypothetical protein
MPRYAPVVSNRALRALLGVVLGAIALWLSGDRSFSAGVAAYGLFAAAWIVSVGLTDKYRHKYPYRYFAYLTASHAKAAMIMALVLGAGFAMVGRGFYKITGFFPSRSRGTGGPARIGMRVIPTPL